MQCGSRLHVMHVLSIHGSKQSPRLLFNFAKLHQQTAVMLGLRVQLYIMVSRLCLWHWLLQLADFLQRHLQSSAKCLLKLMFWQERGGERNEIHAGVF